MKADLHVHTNFSGDGMSSPEEVVDMALARGLSYIAITDHGTIEGAERAREYATGKGITVLIGQEVSCKEGHVLAINIAREIPDGISVFDAVKMIQKQGGIAVAPHPYFPKYGIGFLAFTNNFDAVEGFNAADHSRIGEKQAIRISKRIGMPVVASSDAHHANHVGFAGIEFDGDIFESIHNGTFKTFGKKIPLNRLLLWNIKVHLKLTGKSDANDRKTSTKKRAKSRRSSGEESFRKT